MEWLSRVIGGCRALFQRSAADEELDAELRSFLDESVERTIRGGMNRESATRAARLELGSAAAVKDRVRDVGWESVVECSWLDLRYAVRGLRRSPGFTAVAALTLALGIGATTSIFSLLDAVILKALPVTRPEELVLVGGPQYPVFQAFQRHTDIFVDLLATSGVTRLDVEIQPGVRERTAVSLVSGSYFSTLGVHAAMGRTFAADDDRVPGQHPVAVVNYGYWQRRLGRDAAVLGRVVHISGTPVTVIGVAPPGFFGEHVGVAPDLWVPLTMWGHLVPGRNLLQSPGTGWLRLVGRVHPGAPTSGVQPALTETFRRVVGEIFGPKMPDDVRRDTARATISLEPAGHGMSNLRTRFARPLQLLMGAVLVVLLIACFNIANLLLARAAARRREIDVRLALGVSRSRLVGQLLTESLVLAAIGGTIGVALSWLGTEALLRLISADGSRLPVAVAVDVRLLIFAAVISTGTAILFGLAPAWQSARAGIASSLVTRREPGANPQQRFGPLLVVAQVALSLVLLMAAGLLLRTIANLRDVDLGFVADRLVVADVNPHRTGYRGDRAVEFSRGLLEKLEVLPGVSSVSLSEHGVLTGKTNGTNLMRPEGFDAGPNGFPQTRWDVVGPQYFSTIGTPLVAGRDFSDRDDAAAPFVVAINEEMAQLFFGDASPIGQRLVWGVGAGQTRFEIVAVARDVKQAGPREERQPRFYLPHLQLTRVRPGWVLGSTHYLVRAAGNPVGLAPAVRRVLESEDPRLSIVSLDTAPELVNRALVRERMVATLLVAFGVLAVGLACLGLYGVIAYHVAQRTNEIGVRLALGAQRVQVLSIMLYRPVIWIGAGVAVGIPAALVASRVAQDLLFELSATDAVSLSGAACAISVMGLLAAYISARRALRVDPLVALRGE